MDFKELYEKYNWGQVTDEERKFVENELRRRKEANEPIDAGYELESGETNSGKDDISPINDSSKETENKKSNNENIDKTTREHGKINVPFVVLSCIMAAVIVTAIAVYVMKIDPMVKYVKEEKAQENYPYSDWDIDTKTLYSEKTDAQLGYETIFQFHNKGKSIPTFENLGEIDKKKGQYYYRIVKNTKSYLGITLNKVITVEKPEFQSCANDGSMFYINNNSEDEEDGNLQKKIRNMKENKSYDIMLSLSKLIDDKQLNKLLKRDYYEEDACIKWVGIYPDNNDDEYPPIGIYLGYDQSNIGCIKELIRGYSEMYSVDKFSLKGNGYFYNGKNFFIYRSLYGHLYDDDVPMLDAKTVKESFSERLDFMIKHPEVLNFLGHSEYKEFYREIKNIVDKDDTKYYALALSGSKDVLKKICKGLNGYVTEMREMDEDENSIYNIISGNGGDMYDGLSDRMNDE